MKYLHLIWAELLVGAGLKKKSTGRESNVALRGVGERAWELRPQSGWSLVECFNLGCMTWWSGATSSDSSQGRSWARR
jgi:hypothetical protein